NWVLATPAALASLAGAAQADILDFSSLQHGEIITPTTYADIGVVIEAVNFRLPGAAPMAFDTQFIPTADPDLTGPPWDGGNLPRMTQLGNVVIIPENLVDADGDGIVDDPDDEGRRPAGQLIFSFETPITSFGFDMVDLEGLIAEDSILEFFSDGFEIGQVDFLEFIDPLSPVYDPTLDFGNNTLNRFTPIDVSLFAGGQGEGEAPRSFDRVIINLGGSGAFDNIVYTPVPTPGSLTLLGIAGLAANRRRR
ncbi:MAG: hypothetical protein ACTS22_09880, partial [Phycisphaerales bacterium]